MATLRDMFDVERRNYKNPPSITNLRVLRSLIVTAWYHKAYNKKDIMVKNDPAVEITISADLIAICYQNLTIPWSKTFGFINDNKFIGFVDGKSVITDVSKKDNKYEISPASETLLEFVDVLDKPIYADLISIWFLDNISIESFMRIKPINDDVTIRALNMEFNIPRPHLSILSPIEVPNSKIIDVPFEVTNETMTWFIEKLEDDHIVKNPTTSKENAWSMINLIKFFKITI